MNEKHDKPKFIKRLLALGEIWGKELSKVVMDIYWETLENYDIEDVKAAFNHIGKTSRFFPKPADFIEAIDGDAESRASLAWASLVDAIEIHGHGKSVRFDDPAIMSVVAAMGGWIELCQRPDLKFRQREFSNLYRHFARNGHRHPGYLPGLVESENRLSGYVEHIPEPVAARAIGGRKQQKQIEG